MSELSELGLVVIKAAAVFAACVIGEIAVSHLKYKAWLWRMRNEDQIL